MDRTLAAHQIRPARRLLGWSHRELAIVSRVSEGTIKAIEQGATRPDRRITRSEYEQVLDAVQQRLDVNPNAIRQRREAVEHPIGAINARMGATHFLLKTLPKVAAEMASHVLAHNLTRVMNIIGIKPLIAAIRA